ncbi:MAG: hypothetical protein KAF24_01115 [Nitrosopumilaceae archaeon]|nr:hypothetical protein [Nitrosopumilaceae archaeon]
MFWPGMGDPAKRKQTIKFLLVTALIAISVGVVSSLIQGQISLDDPLKNCINERLMKYKITAKLEVFVDNQEIEIPANVGFTESCQKSLYTISDDGIIHAEWENEYAFEIGHFLWMWNFPLRDMDQSKSKIFVNNKESTDFIRTLMLDGYNYKAKFVSKNYDDSKDNDFLPPND